MKNVNKLHIEKHLSVRFNTIAKNYGIKTIGQLRKMLSKMPPHGKISLPIGYMRATTVKKKLERELDSL